MWMKLGWKVAMIISNMMHKWVESRTTDQKIWISFSVLISSQIIYTFLFFFLFTTHFLFGTNFGLVFVLLKSFYFLIKATITLSPARNRSSPSSTLAIGPNLHNFLKPNHNSINKPKPTGTIVASKNPTQISMSQAIIHQKKKKSQPRSPPEKPLIQTNFMKS